MLCLAFAGLLCIAPKLILNILLGITFLLGAIDYKNNISNYQYTRKKILFFLVLPFILLTLLFLFDILFNYSFNEAIKELERKASFVVFPLILLMTPGFIKNNSRAVLNAFAGGCLIVIMISNIHAFHKVLTPNSSVIESSNWDNINEIWAKGDFVNLDPFFYKEFIEIFAISPFYFSTYIAFCIVTLFYTYLYNSNWSKKVKYVTIIVISIFYISLIQLSIRGIILPFFTLTLAFGIWYSFKKLGLIKTIFTFTILLLILSAFIYNIPILKLRLYNQVKTTLITSEDTRPNSITLRKIEVECSWEVFKKAPIFGHGHKDSDAFLHQCLLENLPKPYKSKFNAHNQYLQYLIQYGIIGLFIFLMPFFKPLFIFHKKDLVLYVIFIIIILISFLSESVMSRFYGFMFFFFFYIIIISEICYKEYLSEKNKKAIYNS